VADFTQARITVQHLGRHCLNQYQHCLRGFDTFLTYLGVLATLEEWRDADKADVVVPHHSVGGIFGRDLECILKN